MSRFIKYSVCNVIYVYLCKFKYHASYKSSMSVLSVGPASLTLDWVNISAMMTRYILRWKLKYALIMYFQFPGGRHYVLFWLNSDCPAATILDSPLQVNTNETRYGEEVIFDCSQGYWLSGHIASRCQLGGAWSAEHPRCIRKIIFYR